MYDPQRIKKIRQTKWSPIELAVLAGAVRSPACCQGRANTPTACPRYPALGTYQHVFWECPHDLNRTVATPTDRAQKRYGWLVGRLPKYDNDVLQHMITVAQEIWDARYSRTTTQPSRRPQEKVELDTVSDLGTSDEEEEDTNVIPGSNKGFLTHATALRGALSAGPIREPATAGPSTGLAGAGPPIGPADSNIAKGPHAGPLQAGPLTGPAACTPSAGPPGPALAGPSIGPAACTTSAGSSGPAHAGTSIGPAACTPRRAPPGLPSRDLP